jgi:hypothetical protein
LFYGAAEMGRSAARFHAKICSNFAQSGFGVMGICCGDPNRIGHLKDLPPVSDGAAFHALQRRRVAQQSQNLDTASYATISGSGDSVTFETQRLIPASGKPPVGFSLSQWNVVSMRSVICLLLSV